MVQLVGRIFIAVVIAVSLMPIRANCVEPTQRTATTAMATCPVTAVGKGSFRFPRVQPAGITGDTDSFWILNGASRRILYRSSTKSEFKTEIQLTVTEPRGIAFDGHNLWVADNGTKRLYYLDATTGQEIRSIKAPSPLSRNSGELTDVSWDGRWLWTAVSAGFASSFNQLDSKDGEIARSLYANCNPAGLAVRSGRLWSLCYNGQTLPYTLNEMRLADHESQVHESAHAFGTLRSEEAAGLFLDGHFLWLLEATGPRCFVVK